MYLSQPLQLHVTYMYKDWLQAERLYRRTTLRSKIEKAIAIGFGLMSIYFAVTLVTLPPELRSFWDYAALTLSFLVAIEEWFDGSGRFHLWRAHRNASGKPPKEYVFTFTAEQAQYSSHSSVEREDFAISWSKFKGMIENQAVFLLLYKEERSYWAIPKRCFPDDTVMTAFRTLVHRSIPEAH